MIDILSTITKGKTGMSKANAKDYANDILGAIHKVKLFQNIVNQNHPVIRQHSDDTLIKTGAIDLNGEKVILSMAFCAETSEPYSAEIIRENDDD